MAYYSSSSSSAAAAYLDHHRNEPHFLESCFLCRKPLGCNADIFMYRGNTPFCCKECRQEQMEIDEAKEKSWKRSSAAASSSSSLDPSERLIPTPKLYGRGQLQSLKKHKPNPNINRFLNRKTRGREIGSSYQHQIKKKRIKKRRRKRLCIGFGI